MQEHSTLELVQSARMGNKEAFGILLEQHQGAATHLARQMIGDADIALELTQEALLQAYLSLCNLRDDARFQPWLHAIVRNVCRNYLRRQRLDDAPLEMDAEIAATPLYFHDTVEPLAALEQKELSNLVETAVSSLSAKNQAAVRLFYYEQLDVQEIAALLGASVSAIKGRLFQARRQMQAQLSAIYPTAEWAETLGVSGQKERKITMFQINGIYAVEVKESNHYILYLISQEAKRLISVWVGHHEGRQIDMILRGEETARPMTIPYMAAIFEKFHIELESVRIDALRDSTYYAVTALKQNNETVEVDGRPSDAVPLALSLKRPIYVSQAVMEGVGQELPEPFDEESWLAAIVRERKEQYEAAQIWVDVWLSSQRLTERAIAFYQYAQAAAKERNHNYIGTEHFLLALMQAKEGVATTALQQAGVTLAQVDTMMEEKVGCGQTPLFGERMLAPRAKQVLRLAAEAVQSSQAERIDTNHVLLGLLAEGAGMAMTILRELGVDTEELEKQLRRRI
ncbi:MAG: DUF151 domain-containing protein [Caldilineaceae bacterium]